MEYSNLFIRTWMLLWNKKFLWIFGFWGSIGKSVGSIIQVWVVGRLPALEAWSSQPGLLGSQIENLLSRPLGWLIGWGVFVFIISIIFWLIVTLTEGALINAVVNMESGFRVSWQQALKMGWRFLGRFIGIDTLVFFPLFLLLLLLMLLILGFLVGTTVYTFNGASIESVMGLLAIGLVCLIPLLCLLLPMSFLTAVFRTLAFRVAVIRDAGLRDSIRHTWRLIRQHAGKLFILVALLWGVGYLINLILSISSIPLIGAAVLPVPFNSSSTALSWIIYTAVIVISIGVHSFLYSFISAVWTLAYAELIHNGQGLD